MNELSENEQKSSDDYLMPTKETLKVQGKLDKEKEKVCQRFSKKFYWGNFFLIFLFVHSTTVLISSFRLLNEFIINERSSKYFVGRVTVIGRKVDSEGGEEGLRAFQRINLGNVGCFDYIAFKLLGKKVTHYVLYMRFKFAEDLQFTTLVSSKNFQHIWEVLN
ncbi:hypothetical protein Tcan_01854 [Toxocara canis]|uniref:Transmembrane protein n=1 Tax=Toxocara canis TaxID=6265 RepID=A0A0B2V1Y8_TOXCA|nr:hypothetical protein Tcan_01854 [Toxocara canis]